MTQVKARTKCFIDNFLRNEGDVFEYNGPKNRNLEPVGGSPSEESDEPKSPSQSRARAKWASKTPRDDMNMDS